VTHHTRYTGVQKCFTNLNTPSLITELTSASSTFFYSRIMAGAIELTEFLSLFKLPWFVFVCISSLDSIFARAYFIVGLWSVVYVRK
jgi:hypothetical protein